MSVKSWREEAELLNRVLHKLAGEPVCASACTHMVTGRWSLLGLANVAARNGDKTSKRQGLVAALIAEGGEIREAGHDLVAREWRLVSYVVDEPGDYLVYGPIPVESAEANGESPEVPA